MPTLTDLLRDGTITTRIDEKYPQAIGIESILRLTALFGNFKWEVLHNQSDENAFFTSDFPVAIEKTDDPRILNRIVPLAPDLALRIKPDPAIDRDHADFSFTTFACSNRKPGFDELVRLNRSIVRCAEDFVFYRDDNSWVRSCVSRNRWFRIEPSTDRLPTDTGRLLVSALRIVARPPSAAPNKKEAVSDGRHTPA